MAVYDLVALAAWLVLLPGIKRIAEDRLDLSGGDVVFISVVVLVVMELLWLRIGYGAP